MSTKKREETSSKELSQPVLYSLTAYYRGRNTINMRLRRDETASLKTVCMHIYIYTLYYQVIYLPWLNSQTDYDESLYRANCIKHF